MPVVKPTSGFVERGGNGKLTVPQTLLLEALGKGWFAEYVYPTGWSPGCGFPKSYKIDIANPGCWIAVEIDGCSHRSAAASERDARKEEFLRSRGWKVYRFENKEVVRKTPEIAEMLSEHDCPTDAVAASITERDVDDFFAYDIIVDPNHCFYAHGVLVHDSTKHEQ